MKKVKWSIYLDGRHVDSGYLEAESDKEALERIMLERDGKLAPDKSYAFTAGELSTSSYGDELGRSARVASHGMTETETMDSGYHFKPKLADVGIDKELMDIVKKANDRTWDDKDSDPVGDIKEAVKNMKPGERIIIDDPHVKKKRECPVTMSGKHYWHNDLGVPSNECLACGAKLNSPLPKGGTDRIVGIALNDGKPGDFINIQLNNGAGQWTLQCANYIDAGEDVRLGADHRVYGPHPGPAKSKIVYSTDKPLRVRRRPGEVVKSFNLDLGDDYPRMPITKTKQKLPITTPCDHEYEGVLGTSSEICVHCALTRPKSVYFSRPFTDPINFNYSWINGTH